MVEESCCKYNNQSGNSDYTESMDLKRVQEDLRRDILHHQALMERLKTHPTDHALNLKLKDVQLHIADLGSQQKKILEKRGEVSKGNVAVSPRTAVLHEKALSPSTYLTQQYQVKNLQQRDQESLTSAQKPVQSVKPTDSNSGYALITLKSPSSSSSFTQMHATASTSNVAMNLTSQVASNGGSAFLPSSALLMVTSPNQSSSNKRHMIGSNLTSKSVSIPVSLASLASNGGVVTLAGTWNNNKKPSFASGASDRNMFVQAKQVQIKVPVVQSPRSKPLILMSQKKQSANAKSLFRLLPKATHSLSVTTSSPMASGTSAQAVIPSATVKSEAVTSKQLSAFLMPSETGSNPQPVQQVFLQRTKQNSSAQSPPTWKDLSSQTPTARKPSYVPKKTFPNINNGVGSFQKFRILDGKAETAAKNLSHAPNPCTTSNGAHEKPRHAALKAVLTSRAMSSTSSMTLARIMPQPDTKNGFVPIQHHDESSTPGNAVKPLSSVSSVLSFKSNAAFTPLSSTIVGSNAGKMCDSRVGSGAPETKTKEKLGFLRNIDLIPKEQAEKVRGRRFRKRRVAANPVYSGGMYVTNEFEPKRQCPDLLASASETITAPDVIVKRPRGRPRGSKNSNALALKLQSSRANRTGSPASQASVQYVRQLKDILDNVSAGKPTSSGVRTGSVGQNQAGKNLFRASRSQYQSGKMKGGCAASDRSESPGSDDHEDQCAICGKTGEVLMCDTCSRVYHLSCATPPLSAVPRGMWVCSVCKEEFKESKSETEWPGIVGAVHSFMEFNGKRDREMEACRKKITETKRVVSSQQVQMKALTAVVTAKVNNRVNATKEEQTTRHSVDGLTSITKKIWNLASLTIEAPSTA